MVTCARQVLVVLWLLIVVAPVSAGLIDSSNNGDLSLGNTTNWNIEQVSGLPVFIYQDAGAPNNGILRSQPPAVTTYGNRAWHTTLCPAGNNGTVQFQINALGSSGGTFGVCFLGDPVYAGGGIPVYDNNDYCRGYLVQMGAGYGTFSATLCRKSGGWGRTELANWSTPYSTIAPGWHTVSIRDNLGNIAVQLDGQTILTASEGANYLPTVYAADYTNGGYWGVCYDGRAGWADVSFDNLMVGGVPGAATDLAAAADDWFQVSLSWTAPSDFPPGPVMEYDIRYSTSLITEANWAGATACTGEPAGANPGTRQTFTIGGLQGDTVYYFAMRSLGGAQASALSNVANVRTPAQDAVAPAAVSDLAGTDLRANRVTLLWTSTGDDGVSGAARQYDLRYSTNPIADDAGFNAATPVAGLAAPRPAGSAEGFTLRGLSPQTTYYVALKVADEVPNWSTISNVLSFTTPVADLTPPTVITDLRCTGAYTNAAYLTWTAPSDSGGAGTGAYDVRYSTSPITEQTWAGATPAEGMPVPAAPGTRESVTVGGLSSDTTYYFAVKTLDQAEPPNVSAISNVVSGRTLLPIRPVTIHNPWISNDRVADCRTLQTIAATFDKSYTPDGVTTPDPSDIQTRAINEYNNFKRRLYHWGLMPPNNRDVVEQMNVYGWALCGSHASMNACVLYAMGLHPRTICIANGGHTIWEIEYPTGSGKWHCLDTMTTYYVWSRTNPPYIASMAEVKADKSLVLNAVAENRACPGFLLCGDTPQYFADGSNSWDILGDPGTATTTKSMNMDLRIGESFSRTCESWANQYTSASTTPPYHHEAGSDWKDSVNLPYWEPYKLNTVGNAAIGIAYSTTYRRWANGTCVLAPDFRSAGYQASLQSGTNVATYYDDGKTPDLHVAATGTLAEAVFKVVTPYLVTDATIDGTFVRATANDLNRILVSTDGNNWTQVWDNSATGTTQLSKLSLHSQVADQYQYFVKVQLRAAANKTDAGVSGLVITSTFEHNKGGLPYLDKGVNHITVTLDNPQDLASGAAFKVTYTWKEYDGTGWTIARSYEQYVTASPTTFTITTGGAKVPRTEAITMEVTGPPIPDTMAPAPVGDLAVTMIDSAKAGLSWTATGDDWLTGQATSYDLRCSTSPITDDASFLAATRVTGTPAPKAPGSTETFVASGLTPSTTYYFAIKVKDEGGNASDLSNVVSLTTLPPDVTPPAAITDLAAQPGTQSGSVLLTWTAPGDDGTTGTAASYELRYQPQAAGPITAANWASATLVAGVQAPGLAGTAEQFTVPGLTWGARYYFAIVARDEVPNTSGISNSPLGTAASLGVVTLQDGLNGYNGCRDNYIYVGNPTRNSGTSSLLRVTGYGSVNEMQRTLVRFDLSSIPAGLPITRATLWLYSNNPVMVKGSTGFYGAYRLTQDWSETTSCWNTPWATPGGSFDAAPDGVAAKQSAAASPCWYAFDVTARVQAWVNSPSDNYGWLIKCTDEQLNNQDEFASADSPDAAFHPKLVISDLPTADTVAPAAVANLAGTDRGDATIQLTWTASGDDGATGTAWGYDLRYTIDDQGPVTDANWDTLAQAVSGLPLPKPAGSAESFVVVGLPANHTYHFALKVIDEAGNTSGLSNVVDVWLASAPRTVVLQAGKDGPMYGLVAGGNTNRGSGGRYDLAVDGSANVNGVLMQFDLSGVLGAGERIAAANLDLYSVRQQAGNAWNLDLRVYPLLAPWVEGIGTTDGIAGSTSSPWGPAAIGDAVYSYRQVTAVAPLPTWGNYDGAAAGIAWAAAGARGIGTDVSDELMVSQNVSGVGHTLGQKLCTLPFTPVGVDVANQWARGLRPNYGLNLFPLSTSGTGFIAAGTREYDTAGWRTTLTLSIVPAPLGDVDGNGQVDVVDLLYLVDAFGSVSGDANYDSYCDFNNDGGVDVIDLLILVENFGMQ